MIFFGTIDYYFSLLLVNSLFVEDKNYRLNFKGTKFIRSTSSYKYIRLLRDSDSCDFYVPKDEFDKFLIGDVIEVNTKKGLLGLMLIDDIHFKRN